jgi:hydroxymethylbilane synthase
MVKVNSTIASEASVARTHTLRIGTRGSALALYQANLVVERLRRRHPDVVYDVHIVSTQGDRDKETPLTVIGGQGVFAKELEFAIQAGDIDCAVHSLKDLPSLMPSNLMLAAILERHDHRDVLVSRHPGGLKGLPAGARVGTSSRRRMVQLHEARPDASTVELRGNVDTRISKVFADDSPYDAAILAAAGVTRMNRTDAVAEFLDVDVFTPAPGQAALAVECRQDDMTTRALLASIHDESVAALVNVERAFLRGVGGGCRSPIGAFAEWRGSGIRLRAMVSTEDLTRTVRLDECFSVDSAERQAEETAAKLVERVIV